MEADLDDDDVAVVGGDVDSSGSSLSLPLSLLSSEIRFLSSELFINFCKLSMIAVDDLALLLSSSSSANRFP